MADLTRVPSHMTSFFYPLVRGMIEAGYAASDELVPADMKESLELGGERGRHLWVVDDEKHDIIAAMVTRFQPKVSGKVLQLIACGGERMAEWLTFEPRFVEYAKAEGCVKVMIKGRRGWLRALEGYRETEITIEKQVG